MRILPAPVSEEQKAVTSAQSEEPQLSQSVKAELLDLYFRHLQHKPHTMFHEPSFRRSVLDGSVNKAVFYGVLANSVRFVPNTYICPHSVS